jgi:hypothetical protein
LIAYEASLLGFIKFAVNPLLNSVGCHAHEVRVRLASRNCFVDLELPFPQSRFHLRDGEFNTSAVHLCSPPDMPSRATQSQSNPSCLPVNRSKPRDSICVSAVQALCDVRPAPRAAWFAKLSPIDQTARRRTARLNT